MKLPLIFTLFVLLCFFPFTSVEAQNAIPHDVTSCGGGESNGGGLFLHDSLGQPCIGITNEASNVNKIGYWYVIDAMHIGPTSEVAISAFMAEIREEGVVLSWQLESSSEIVGLNVYRSKEEGKYYSKLNEELVPSEHGSYLDKTAHPGTTYWYRLGAVDSDGEFLSSERKVEIPPRETTLYQNYPNPFNPVTTVSYYVPSTSRVSLVIFDVHGKVVRTLVSRVVGFGKHDVTWEGINDRGETVASGVYFYRLSVGKKIITKKLTLVK
jgi:hypothetical protein